MPGPLPQKPLFDVPSQGPTHPALTASTQGGGVESPISPILQVPAAQLRITQSTRNLYHSYLKLYLVLEAGQEAGRNATRFMSCSKNEDRISR